VGGGSGKGVCKEIRSCRFGTFPTQQGAAAGQPVSRRGRGAPSEARSDLGHTKTQKTSHGGGIIAGGRPPKAHVTA
jgi:hypothetical protein